MTYAQYAILAAGYGRWHNPQKREPATGTAADLLMLSKMKFA